MTPAVNETGQALRTLWLGALAEIADLDLQRRTWLNPANTNPHWSYVEFVCSYPDADQLREGREKGWLSPAESQILLDFEQRLSAHQSPTGNDYDNEAILNDPAWHSVVQAAQKALLDLSALPQR